GLSISEKMRKQIRGLTQASLNAQDGISAVQTAEGALNEVQDMLQRANELAVKASNGTMSEADRSYIQNEINQLTTEIDRVATTTKFNETYLLKGNNKGSIGHLTYDTAIKNLQDDFEIDATYNAKVNEQTGTISIEIKKVEEPAGTAGRDIAGTDTRFQGREVKIGTTTYIVVNSTGLKENPTGTVALTVSQAIKELEKGGTAAAPVKAFTSMDEMLQEVRNTYGEDVRQISTYIEGKGEKAKVMMKVESFADLNEAVDLSLHVGADGTEDNKIAMNISMMSARGLGVNGLKVTGETGKNATLALDTIADAIQMISSQRSALGAIQNRLEHTIANLDNVVENTTASESQIRDTDMATEMVKYSNNNILAQAGQSMLAQSNQANQGVLALLQ
ncbi:MAG: flagellin, partial [Lachnospiraceae bacterium]|nr:flagellin [Lachnospiraceae bacterium]